MKDWKILSGNKLVGSIVSQETLEDLLKSEFFDDGVVIRKHPIHNSATYVVISNTVRTWGGHLVVLKPAPHKPKGLPAKKHLVYHPHEMPAFEETFTFETAPKWLKRACGRITFSFTLNERKYKRTFKPTHFAYYKGCVWAWDEIVSKVFDRFDKDLEESTFGLNSSEHEKERHARLYQSKKEKQSRPIT